MTETSWTQRLFGGMRRTSERIGENLGSLTSGGTVLDAQTLDDVEDALVASDLGPATASPRQNSTVVSMRKAFVWSWQTRSQRSFAP